MITLCLTMIGICTSTIYVYAFKSVFDIDIRRIASSLWKLVERMHSVCVYIVLCIYISALLF